MKRILITGMQKSQYTFDYYLNQQLKVVPSHYSLIRCLRDMDYVVDQRIVRVGETLDEYDHVICFLHNAGGFASSAVYNACWAIHQRSDIILAYDDWQIPSIYKDLTKFKDLTSFYYEFLYNQHEDLRTLRGREEQVFSALDRIRSNTQKILISAFAGGDPSLLSNLKNIVTYNPNPYHLHRQPMFVAPAVKERRYNFASLMQGKTRTWFKKQNCGWPVDFFGSRKDKQVRLTEDKMVDVYAQQWGCLMPGYAHSGSGWWRARPTQVADARSILIGDPKELAIYYGDVNVAKLRAVDIEQLSTHELTTIAQEQCHALYTRHPLDKDVQKRELLEALK